MKPHALVTNDDGIESAFLHRLVDALKDDFQVSVAAPAFEQSWIGRAISRRKEIEAIHSPSIFPDKIDAWAINGTPTDCVNIALGNLIQTPVDIVPDLTLLNTVAHTKAKALQEEANEYF